MKAKCQSSVVSGQLQRATDDRIKAPCDFDAAMTDGERRDAYLRVWWRLREIELERLKLDNQRLREEMLLLSLKIKNRP